MESQQTTTSPGGDAPQPEDRLTKALVWVALVLVAIVGFLAVDLWQDRKDTPEATQSSQATPVAIQSTSLPLPTVAPSPVAVTPPPCVAPPDWVIHTVEEGNTLYSLGQQYSTDVDTLKLVNCLEADTILIDTASGVSSNVLFFSSFADQILLVATPEPTSITDAYATMKVLARTPCEQDFQLMINQVGSEKQGREVYQTLYRAAEHFLNIRPGYVGFVSKDRNLQRAVTLQKPIMEIQPDSKACRDIRTLATNLLAQRLSLPGRDETCGTVDPTASAWGIG